MSEAEIRAKHMDMYLGQFMDKDKVLAELSRVATDFADILAKEVSGERDGNGCWYGSDAFGGAMEEMEPKINRLAEMYQGAVRRENDDLLPF